MPLAFSTAAAEGPVSTLMKASRGFGLLGGGAQTHRIGRVVLDVLRQRPDQGDAGLADDLAVLVDADLGLTGLDQVGDVAALLQLGLRLDLVGDAELVEQVRNVDAARAAARRIDIADRLRLEQRLLEGLDRGDVGLRARPP